MNFPRFNPVAASVSEGVRWKAPSAGESRAGGYIPVAAADGILQPER